VSGASTREPSRFRPGGNGGAFSEDRRQLVHMAMGAFALLLPVLLWWQAAALAVAALVFNATVLPRIASRSLFRPGELQGYPAGILLYPLAVLLLIVSFPQRPDIVAAAWGVLAAGDGSATLVGRRLPLARLPWNPEKSAGGLLAFIVLGSAAAVGLAWWTAPAVTPSPPVWFLWVAPVLAAVAAAAAETLPVRLDDNVTVPVTAGLVLWATSLVTVEAWEAAQPVVVALAPAGLAVNAAVAAAGWGLRTVSTGGAIAGALIGAGIYIGAGPAAWLLLLVTFVVATVASKIGLKRKSLLGIAEERGGRRGPGNAFANTGVALFAALLAALSPHRDAALLALSAALVAGGSDTVASEIGKAWGRRTFLVIGLSPVRPGTPGAVSLEGTAAGLIGAFALAALAAGLGLVPATAVWVLVVAASIGAFAESGLGATLEAPGIVNNDLLNFINTACAAAVAVLVDGALP
jgi:uncharacterized protein (TIGR00297 family)